MDTKKRKNDHGGELIWKLSLAQFCSQILPTMLSDVSGSADNIVASLKEAGWLDYQVLGLSVFLQSEEKVFYLKNELRYFFLFD
jgi:hypothetical protein